MGWVAPSLAIRKRIIVGVADMVVSNDVSADLVTYSLGSCLGITIHDPQAHVGGLLHLMLPSSSIDAEKAKKSPYMFVDTGVPLLFHAAYELGAQKNRITLKVAGGAEVIGGSAYFNIGGRNFEALKEILARNSMNISSNAVGGQVSRTVSMNIGTGVVKVKVSGEKDFEL